MKIRSVGAELFHADRHDEANSRFSQFCKWAKKIAQTVVFVSSRGMLGEKCVNGIDYSPRTLIFCYQE
jgi:hypothetical protein